MQDFNPDDIDAAVSEATDNPEGEAVGDPLDSHADAEGLETSTSSRSLRDRLLETNPDKPLREYSDELWNPEDGGIARILRGLEKAGIPINSALADLLIGAAEEATKHDINNDTGHRSEESDETDQPNYDIINQN